jgi:hypothetical protein
METKEFFKTYNRMTGNATPARMSSVRDALARTGLVPARKRMTARAAAWVIIGNLAPTSEKTKLRVWMQEQAAFFAEQAAQGFPSALSILTRLFQNRELANETEAVYIEVTTLVTTIYHVSGEQRTPTQYSLKPIPDVAQVVKISGQAIREIWHLVNNPNYTLN